MVDFSRQKLGNVFFLCLYLWYHMLGPFVPLKAKQSLSVGVHWRPVWFTINWSDPDKICVTVRLCFSLFPAACMCLSGCSTSIIVLLLQSLTQLYPIHYLLIPQCINRSFFSLNITKNVFASWESPNTCTQYLHNKDISILIYSIVTILIPIHTVHTCTVCTGTLPCNWLSCSSSLVWGSSPPHETWSHLVLHIVKPRGFTWGRGRAAGLYWTWWGIWLHN